MIQPAKSRVIMVVTRVFVLPFALVLTIVRPIDAYIGRKFPSRNPFVYLPSTSSYDGVLCQSLHEESYGADETGVRLESIRQTLAKMQHLQNPSDSTQQLLGETAIDSLALNQIIQKATKVRVGPSSIANAGKGLFAAQNVKAGTIVSFYPVHGMGVDCLLSSSSVCLGSNDQDQAYFDSQERTDSSGNNSLSNYMLYLIGSRPIGTDTQFSFEPGPDVRPFVDVNPAREDSNGWLGHYVNDGATVVSNDESGQIEYYQQSRSRKNCVHIPFGPAPILATVTTRKVKKNEEFFTSYGVSYWLDALIESNSSIDGAGDNDEPTENVIEEAQLLAKDIFDAMQRARLTYVNQQEELNKVYTQLPLDV